MGELDEKVSAGMKRVAGEFYTAVGEEGKRLGVGAGGIREGWAKWVKWDFEKEKDGMFLQYSFRKTARRLMWCCILCSIRVYTHPRTSKFQFEEIVERPY